MPHKILEKEKYPNKLEKDISVISVINNYKKRPYLELFHYVPENMLLQSLGTLSGFFKINDKSEDSAYIVNFLASVVKKEYYANSSRSAQESFDAEILYVARKHGLRIVEVPVRWINSPESRVHPVSDSARMAYDLLTIRIKDVLGRYA